MKAVDLFAGWGGMSEGARQAGVDVVWAANHWPLAVATHEANHPSTEHACQDLRQADWTKLPEFDLLLAAPACQGHSTASQARRRAYHDELRATAFAVLDCLDATRPKACLVENVPAFMRWEAYDWYLDGFKQFGYDVEARVVVASKHADVPQRRRRLMLLATKPGVTVRPFDVTPEPAFGPHLHADDEVPSDAWVPVRSGTPNVRKRIARSRKRHGDRFLTQHTTDHNGTPLDEPIRTITTASNHWNLVNGEVYRPLTGRELARGMGFPDTYTWDETLPTKDVTKGLGNAVPPPLAKVAVEALADAAA